MKELFILSLFSFGFLFGYMAGKEKDEEK